MPMLSTSNINILECTHIIMQTEIPIKAGAMLEQTNTIFLLISTTGTCVIGHEWYLLELRSLQINFLNLPPLLDNCFKVRMHAMSPSFLRKIIKWWIGKALMLNITCFQWKIARGTVNPGKWQFWGGNEGIVFC